jgi:hypothetical protein
MADRKFTTPMQCHWIEDKIHRGVLSSPSPTIPFDVPELAIC